MTAHLHLARTDPDAPRPDPTGLLSALRAVLAPLARLAVSRGVPYGEVDALVREVFVEAARDAHRGVAPNRVVSRLSAATGLSRREVTRLVRPVEPALPRRSVTGEVFARWISDPQFAAQGAPLPRLPRSGAHPSFQSLVESVSRDVKPRTHLEELCRLGLVRIDDALDCVELLRDKFVPHGDEAQLFGLLGDNVGDHLAAAVDNVGAGGVPHLEQALFADELSAHAIDTVRPLIDSEWKQLVRTLAPALQRLIDEDLASGRIQDRRLRIGMYAYTAPMADASGTPPGAAPAPLSSPSQK